MATELLHDLMKRSGELTPAEKQRLALFLSEQVENRNGDEASAPPGVNESASVDAGIPLSAAGLHSQRREQHLAWLKAHREEYSGRYVALDGDQLKGDGRTIREATEQAQENGCESPFLVYVLSSAVVAEGGL
jgi:hypothetical protein